jgi:hypothetical protein
MFLRAGRRASLEGLPPAPIASAAATRRPAGGLLPAGPFSDRVAVPVQAPLPRTWADPLAMVAHPALTPRAGTAGRTVTPVLATVAEIFLPIAPVFLPIDEVLPPVAPVFQPVPEPPVMLGVTAVFPPVAEIFPAVLDVFPPVAPVFQPVPAVLQTIRRPGMPGRPPGILGAEPLGGFRMALLELFQLLLTPRLAALHQLLVLFGLVRPDVLEPVFNLGPALLHNLAKPLRILLLEPLQLLLASLLQLVRHPLIGFRIGFLQIRQALLHFLSALPDGLCEGLGVGRLQLPKPFGFFPKVLPDILTSVPNLLPAILAVFLPVEHILMPVAAIL